MVLSPVILHKYRRHIKNYGKILVFSYSRAGRESYKSTGIYTHIYVTVVTNFSTGLRFITEAPSLRCLQNEKATALYKNNLCSYASKYKIYDDSQL